MANLPPLSRAWPFRRIELEIPGGRAEVVFDRLDALVTSRSLVFANYFRHRGQFVGHVAFPRFCVRRYVRDLYVALVRGEVRARGGRTVLCLCFRAFDVLAVGAFVAMAVGMMWTDAAFGAAFLAFGVAFHVRGCFVFEREIADFLSRLDLK